MIDTHKLLFQGCLQDYDIQIMDGYNGTVQYTSRRFGEPSLQKLYSVAELPILHN